MGLLVAKGYGDWMGGHGWMGDERGSYTRSPVSISGFWEHQDGWVGQDGSIPRVGEMGQELWADVAAMALRPAQTSQLRGYSQGTMFQPWERVMRLPVPSLGFWARSGPSLTVGLVIASSGLA